MSKSAGKSNEDLEDFDTVPELNQNQKTSKLCYSKNVTEEEINKDKVDKRYKLMMSKLNEVTLEEKEQERIKSAKAKYNNKKSNTPSTSSKPNETNEEAKKVSNEVKQNTLKAPNELLEEFLVYVMQKNYPDALKLCGFILMYEPHNALAKEYLPILEQKVAILEDRGESSSESDSGPGASDDSSDESDSTTDDSDDDSSSDSESDEKIKKDSDDLDDIVIPSSSSANQEMTQNSKKMLNKKVK